MEDHFHLGIKVLLCTNERKILLLRKQHPRKGLIWDIPGGRLQKEETVMQTLAREVEEETGFQCPDDIFPLDMILTDCRIPTDICEVGLIISFYYCNIGSSFTPKLSAEHIGYEWFSFSETAELLKGQFPSAFLEKITQMDRVNMISCALRITD